jgi:hypothetical protein
VALIVRAHATSSGKERHEYETAES